MIQKLTCGVGAESQFIVTESIVGKQLLRVTDSLFKDRFFALFYIFYSLKLDIILIM